MSNNSEPTPHERRLAAMTYRDRLIFRLIRRIAKLLGHGDQFDAECDRIASLSESEVNNDMLRKLDELRGRYEQQPH